MAFEILEELADALKSTKDLGEKQELLLTHPKVAEYLNQGALDALLPFAHDLSAKIALFSVVAIDQFDVLFAHREQESPKEKIKVLLAELVAIDRFYESIGGIVGYQIIVLKLLGDHREKAKQKGVHFSRPDGIDLSKPSPEVNETVFAGLKALDEIGELYPIGGLGSRLNLLSKKNEPLPAACLLFGGRTLLEGLIRDVQAREFVFYRLFHRQVTVPIAMMSSWEKKNTERVRAICKKEKWFGRPEESFKIFPQISVPVVTEEGKWSMKGSLEMNLQPGGHGALWKAAEEAGVFFWFQTQEKSRLLIRQINNPIAGIDHGLLAFVGAGKKGEKAFGFASCERVAHAAEGVLVLLEENGRRRIANIEYTDLKRFGIEDETAFPTNTNILYADLSQIVPILKKIPLTGLMLNMKNKEPYLHPSGEKREVRGGRLESMMQSLSEALEALSNESLPTFVTYNERRKTISAIKKSFEVGKSLLETPEGTFYDLLYNAHRLLQHCKVEVDPFSSTQDYLEQGPSHIFLYHPALGPLYSIITQKIRKGKFALGAELQLEIADIILENFTLDGSLIIHAEQVLGHDSQGITRYSQRTGKCFLKNVTVSNKGINRKATRDYWKNKFKRREALIITLQGHSEFHAENITFPGRHTITVPDGECWTAHQTSTGEIHYTISKPTTIWEYREINSQIKLEVR